MPELEFLDPFLEQIRPHLESEPVEIAVARMQDRAVDVRHAVMRHRMHEAVTELDIAVLNPIVGRRNNPFIERGDRGHQLPGRTRRESALNDPAVNKLTT